jgi:GTP-binding protein EngB required for normal cell division
MSMFKNHPNEFICNLKTINQYLNHLMTEPQYQLFKEIAFLGRSNVGKSTLINNIINFPLLKCSKTPGKTQNLHFI